MTIRKSNCAARPNNRKFRDTETGKTITETELKAVFFKLKQEQPEEYSYTFEEYIKNCTCKNGFLEEIK